MNAFESSLTGKVAAGRKLLVPYLTAGLPTDEGCIDLICSIAKSADAVEIGIPFSDPIMDGPVIQRSSNEALSRGVSIDSTMGLVSEVKQKTDLPVALMTYFNPVHRIGLERFVQRASSAGVGALIVPDLPFEEAGGLAKAAEAAGIDLVQMIAPTSTDARVSILASASRGFVYAVSRLGVTGEQRSLGDVAKEVVARIRPHAKAPILVGLGISDPAQAAEAVGFADGVIIGSAVVARILAGQGSEAVEFLEAVRARLDEHT